MRIEEFSRSAGVSPRMIRHFGTKGLLNPARINKYRRFSKLDMRIVRRILLFQRLGFSLAQITRLFRLPEAKIRSKLAGFAVSSVERMRGADQPARRTTH